MERRDYIWEVKAKEAVGKAEEYCRCVEWSYPKEQAELWEKRIWAKEVGHMMVPSEVEGV